MSAKETKQAENMLVRSEDLDQLLTLAGEVIVVSSNQSILSRGLQDAFNKQHPVDQEIVGAAKDLSGATTMLSSELHHLVQSIRTVDLKDLSFRFRRLMRNTSRLTGKAVNFDIVGVETNIDKSIVEKLYDPIAHQLRNAIDHGIEDGQTRKQLGKTPEGNITLTVYNTEQETFIEIKDDGKGVNLEALRQKAISTGIIQPSQEFTHDTALNVMCTPGLSTAEQVSEVSGRGVGMDVVKNHLDDLGGAISFTTQPGQGSVFTFRIPLLSAVNIIDALVVRAKGVVYAFPIANVVASVSVSRSELSSVLDKKGMIKYLGNLLPLHNLDDVMNKRDTNTVNFDEDPVNILVVEHKVTRIAFVVSNFLAPQKLVIIPFNGTLSVKGLAGSTILGAKQLGYVVDIPALLELTAGDYRTVAEKRLSLGSSVEKAAAEIALPAAETEEPTVTAAVVSEIDNAVPVEEDDATFNHAFVGELERLCSELNESIFRLENNARDKETINATFRLLHTIKGNLIMMGLPHGGETVHSVESVLDHVRSNDLEVSETMMDVIMEGVSYIESIVQQVKAGTWKDKLEENIISRSKELLPTTTFEHEAGVDVADAEIKLAHEAAYRVLMHRRHQKQFYRLYIEFDAGQQPSFLIACLIYKRMCEVGDVLGTLPGLGDIEKGLMQGKMKMLFVSDESFDALNARLESFLKEHYGATLVKLTSVVY